MSDTTTAAVDKTRPIPFDNSYARLPDLFFAPVDPTPVEAPRLIKFNRALALDLGLDDGGDSLRQIAEFRLKVNG